ncbi:hypothetical protein Tco_0212670 [Tanacetum coccineum]
MERLGYPIPIVLEVNLILTLLLKDYDQFVQNYNMHSMGKTIPALHAMLKLAEKGIPKKASADLAIRQAWTLEEELSSLFGRVEEATKPTQSATWGLKEFRKFNKGALDLYVGNVNRATVEAIGGFDLIILSGMVFVPDNYHFTPSITRGVISLSYERKPFTYASERDDDLLGIIHSDSNDVANAFWGYALESVARILNMVPIKKVDKTTYEIWHGKVSNLSYLKNSLISQEASGRTVDFDEIQRQDAQPSENTSEHHPEVKHEDVKPQSHVNPIRRSARIPKAPE